jgi:DNA topoisomerase VI subunit A
MKHGNSAYSFPNSVITDSDMFTIHIFEYRYCGNITASAVGIEAISWISLEMATCIQPDATDVAKKLLYSESTEYRYLLTAML